MIEIIENTHEEESTEASAEAEPERASEDTQGEEATEASAGAEPTREFKDELDEVLQELRETGSQWAALGLGVGKQVLEATADTLKAQREERDEGNGVDETDKAQRELDGAVKELIQVGRTWAKYGLGTSRGALEATADTLRSTAGFLGKISGYLDARLAEVPNHEEPQEEER